MADRPPAPRHPHRGGVLRAAATLSVGVGATALLGGCSTTPRTASTGPRRAASSASAVTPLTIADANIRLISAQLTPATAGHQVYLDATIVNDNPTPVTLLGVTFSQAVSPTAIPPHTIHAYDKAILTGPDVLPVGTATTTIARGDTISATLRFHGRGDLTVRLPVQ